MSISTRSVLALAVAGVVGAPAAAQAKPVLPVPLTGESTTITLNGPAVNVLTSNGVTVSAIAPATLSGPSATFPITGGRVNEKITKGFARHAGGVVFTKDGKSLALRNLVGAARGRKGFIAAHTHRRLVRVFKLTNLSKDTDGTATKVTGEVRVTARLAKRLNRRLGTSVERGALAGSLLTKLTTE